MRKLTQAESTPPLSANVKPRRHLSTPHHRWRMEACSQGEVIYPGEGLHPSAAAILARRGITSEEAALFLHPVRENSLLSPYGIRRMNKAVPFIAEAMQNKDKIAVLGDYDVDGCTGTAMLERFFRAVGVDVVTYIPHRINEGYGPNEKAIRKLHRQGVKLLITVDCGTTSYESLQLAHDLGMKVIVTDHHKPDKGTEYPAGAEIVNPNRKDSKYSAEISRRYEPLTGAGVAYLLCEGLFDALDKKQLDAIEKKNRTGLEKTDWFKTHPRPDREALFDKLVVLAALGTYCDVAPITGMNRWLVRRGLELTNQWQEQDRNAPHTPYPLPGIKALINAAGLAHQEITDDHIGFQLGPRLNAAGRIDVGMRAKELLATDDAALADQLARDMDRFNIQRKEIQKSILQEALTQAEAQVAAGLPVILAAGKGWHEGVIGIVAGRLKEIYGKPAFVVTIDEKGNAKGSGRSIEGVDIGDAVISALRKEKLLTKGGGHVMAAGFSLKAERIHEFHDYLNRSLQTSVEKSEGARHLTIDDVIAVKDLTPELAASYGRLGPFGRHNEPPRIAVKDVHIVEGGSKPVGPNHDTLQLLLQDAHHPSERGKAVLFQKATRPIGILLRNPIPHELLQLTGRVRLGSYQGKPQVQFEVDDAYSGPLHDILHTPKLPHAQRITERSSQKREAAR